MPRINNRQQHSQGFKKEIAPDVPWVALVGNPNSGKTALFNELTGMHQHVGNYPGITVEKKTGTIRISGGKSIEIHDLPGTYSLSPQSMDEEIVTDLIYESFLFDRKPKAFIVVLDSTNLERNLFLAGQIIELGIPTILSLNMFDLLHKKGQDVNIKRLTELLGVSHIIPTIAKKGKGIEEIKKALEQILNGEPAPEPVLLWDLPENFKENVDLVCQWFKEKTDWSETVIRSFSLRLIANPEAKRRLFRVLMRLGDKVDISRDDVEILKERIRDAKHQLTDANVIPHSLEARLRYQRIDKLLKETLQKGPKTYQDFSVRADRILTHRIWGILIFIFIMGGIFQAVFSWAVWPMDFIGFLFNWLGNFLKATMAPGIIRDLIVEGILGGVGGILVFLPQILILTALLGILEDSGYLSRASFLMDKIFSRVGLSGRSVVPLLNGYACAIPAIMATRTIKNWEDRLITILITPLMSCSARLPIYVLLISAFVPNIYILGFIPLQGATLFSLYALGTVTAAIVAWVLKKWLIKPKSNFFIMELPPYRLPHLRSLTWQVYEKGKSFVINAGQIILAISIILWFLASFPKNDLGKSDIQQSYAAQIGHSIEPVIAPLGFDWKIGIALVTSFAAREIIISTMNTIYKIEGEDEQLITAIKRDINPKTGEPVFNILTVFSLLIYYVFAAQCMATFAIIKKETNSWRWAFFMIFYMTAIAYTASFAFYQIGRMFINV